MKHKLFEVLICLLLIATVVPVARGAVSWNEEQKLLPSDASSNNAYGCSVSLSGDTALIGAYGDDSFKGSALVFTRTGTTWIQQGKLLASDGRQGDQFGYSVCVDGDTALIGARGDDNNSGSVYVFIRNGTTWIQQAKLTVTSDGAANFGSSVSLEGNTALISASFDNKNHGSAYVFTRTGTTWTQEAKLLASDGASMDFFGWSVSLSGDTALVGAGYGAYVFTRTGTAWTQEAKLLASEIDGYSNLYVSLYDNIALIGTSEGVAYVLTRTGTTWTLQQQLLASDSASRFGCSVSLSGGTALIGALAANGNEGSSGASYVFIRSGVTWAQQAKLVASDGAAGDYFGASVSLDRNTALIGASFWLKANTSAYVFTKSGEDTPPVAGFTWTPAAPAINQTITFNASTSYDSDGFITLYDWDWNADGTYEDSYAIPTVTHSWIQAGIYPVTVRVTDDGGVSNTKTLPIPISSEDDDADNNGTPGFQAILFIAAVCVALLLLRKKK